MPIPSLQPGSIIEVSGFGFSPSVLELEHLGLVPLGAAVS